MSLLHSPSLVCCCRRVLYDEFTEKDKQIAVNFHLFDLYICCSPYHSSVYSCCLLQSPISTTGPVDVPLLPPLHALAAAAGGGALSDILAAALAHSQRLQSLLADHRVQLPAELAAAGAQVHS